jgi:hypothetical protein
MFSSDVSGVTVRLQATLIGHDNQAAFRGTERMLNAIGQGAITASINRYLARLPHGTVRVTINADALLFAALQSNEYLAPGKPAPEPHVFDAANYEQFVEAVKVVIGTVERPAAIFDSAFGAYPGWLEFNRVKTDQEGSTRPGDRESLGNLAASNWPSGFPPSDTGERSLVQSYIVAGQGFMNLCDGLRHLASDLPGVANKERYEAMLKSISAMVRDDIPFPTYFLQPGIVALLKLVPAQLLIDGDLPDPDTAVEFTVKLKAPAAAAGAGR